MDFKIWQQKDKKKEINKRHGQKAANRNWDPQREYIKKTAFQTVQTRVFLPILAAPSEKRFPYMLLANKKAPSSSTSRSMVAVWACSVPFMSFHDSRASGRSRLFTVCTTACNMWRLLQHNTLLPVSDVLTLWTKRKKTKQKKKRSWQHFI